MVDTELLRPRPAEPRVAPRTRREDKVSCSSFLSALLCSFSPARSHVAPKPHPNPSFSKPRVDGVSEHPGQIEEHEKLRLVVWSIRAEGIDSRCRESSLPSDLVLRTDELVELAFVPVSASPTTSTSRTYLRWGGASSRPSPSLSSSLYRWHGRRLDVTVVRLVSVVVQGHTRASHRRFMVMAGSLVQHRVRSPALAPYRGFLGLADEQSSRAVAPFKFPPPPSVRVGEEVQKINKNKNWKWIEIWKIIGKYL